MRVTALFFVSALGAASCGSRSGLELPRAQRSARPDAGFVDAGRDAGRADAGHADAGGHDGSCEWRFAPAVEYDVSGFPTDVTIGDFDGDGLRDVLTVSSHSGQIALLKNLGVGALELHAEGNVGAGVSRFVSADFSGDGSLDLAVLYAAPNTSSSVSIFLNRGDGSFSSMQGYQIASGAPCIVAGDFDGDQRPDLAVCEGLSNVTLLLNQGDGTFRFGPQLDTSFTGASELTVADFDDDGNLDIGAGQHFYLAQLFNQGKARFGLAHIYQDSPLCNDFGRLVAGDLTGDGYPDLVHSCYQARDIVAVRKNDGQGAFGNDVTYAAGGWPFGVVIGDFTGHGQSDLAVANSRSESNSVSVLPGVGDGTFEAPVNYDATGPEYIAAGDLNGDGHADLATAGFPELPASNGAVSVLLSICE